MIMRVIRSTLQLTDIDSDLEEAFADAIAAGAAVRETFKRDEIGQKISLIALMPYTDPTGAHRWAMLNSGPMELDYQDTDDLAEANAAYEREVHEASAGGLIDYDEEGTPLPAWDETDVPGVSAATVSDGEANFRSALLTDATRAHEAFVSAEKHYTKSMLRRQLAFARYANAQGHGGQAVLSAQTKLAPPTVKRVVDGGQKALAFSEIDDCTCIEYCDQDPETACSLSGTPHMHPEIPGAPGVYGPCPVPAHQGRPGDQ